MTKIRYREPDSLYLNVQGIDHTPLTNLLEEHGVKNNGAALTFSGEMQAFIEILDWVEKHPVLLTEICAVLVALINRYHRASIKYTVGGQPVEITNISQKSAIEIANDLQQGPVQNILVDLSQCSQPAETTIDRETP